MRVGLRREDEREGRNVRRKAEAGSNRMTTCQAHDGTLTRALLRVGYASLSAHEGAQELQDAASWKRATSGRTSSGL
jgi:hypothetical protein